MISLYKYYSNKKTKYYRLIKNKKTMSFKDNLWFISFKQFDYLLKKLIIKVVLIKIYIFTTIFHEWKNVFTYLLKVLYLFLEYLFYLFIFLIFLKCSFKYTNDFRFLLIGLFIKITYILYI
jgi:hypothetical protein